MTTEHSSGQEDAPMTLERLRVLLDAYGASPARWPHKDRVAGEALLDRSAAARTMLAEATQLDALLDMAHAPSPSAALTERVRRRRFGWRGMQIVLEGEATAARVARWMLSPKHQAVALAATLVLGVALGTRVPDGDNGPVGNAHMTAAPHSAAAVTVAHDAAPARMRSDGGTVAIEQPAPAATQTAMGNPPFSSNGDPAYDAPDPFGAAAHGMDLVDGARLATGPVPESGEPLGAIPLL